MLMIMQAKVNVRERPGLFTIGRLPLLFLLPLLLLLSKSVQAQSDALDEYNDFYQQVISGVTNALVKLPSGEYIESTLDMRVKVLGGEVRLDRTWMNGRWYLNPAWANLHFIRDPVSQQIKAIDRAGVFYLHNAATGQYTFRQTTIDKVDGSWRWHDLKGNWITYDTSGRLTAYGDRNHIKVEFELDPSGRRIAIKDRYGQLVFNFIYDDRERLIQVKDRSGRSVSYSWQGELLSKVTDVLGNDWLYGYDANGQLTERIEPDGEVVKVVYIASEPAAAMAMNSGKAQNSTELSDTIRLHPADSLIKPTRVGKIIDKSAAETIWDIQQDSQTNQYVVSAEDADGKKTITHFDANGAKLSQSINGVLNETLNREDDRLKNSSGYVLKIISGRGLTASVQFNALRSVVKIIRSDGLSENFEYNKLSGQVSRYTNALGYITDLTYDSKGNLIKRVDSNGQPQSRITRWTYDNIGQPMVIRLNEGAKEVTLRLSFDEQGNVESITDANGQIFTLSYNIQGQIIRIKDPLNRISSFAYNAAGHPLWSSDAQGLVTKYNTDLSGRITEMTDQTGKVTRFSYHYDRGDWIVWQVDPLNQATFYLYDTFGRLVQTIQPSGSVRQQRYHNEGRINQFTDRAGNTISLQYGASYSGLRSPIVSALYPNYRQRYQYSVAGLSAEVSQLLANNQILSIRVYYKD